MPLRVNLSKYITLILAGAVVQFITYVVMLFMHGYYLQPDQYKVLMVTIFIMLGSSVALWILWPSRLVVGLIMSIGSVVPGIYIGSTIFELFNLPRVAVFFVLVLMSIGIAHWCQKINSSS
jgi:hypothetical protein